MPETARSSRRASWWRAASLSGAVVPRRSPSDAVLLQDGLDVGHVVEVVVILLRFGGATAGAALFASHLLCPFAGGPCRVRRSRATASVRRRRTARPTAPATMMPAHTAGENTSRVAQLVTSSTMLTASFRVPVSQAATGTSVQASPRIPAAGPRRRHATQVSAAPMIVSTRASAAQVVLSIVTSAAGAWVQPTYRSGTIAGCVRSRIPASPATWARSTPIWPPLSRRTTPGRSDEAAPKCRPRRCCRGTVCWCLWSRCSARWSTTSRAWRTTRPATWPRS